jgi:hypothetical protein
LKTDRALVKGVVNFDSFRKASGTAKGDNSLKRVVTEMTEAGMPEEEGVIVSDLANIVSPDGTGKRGSGISMACASGVGDRPSRARSRCTRQKCNTLPCEDRG